MAVSLPLHKLPSGAREFCAVGDCPGHWRMSRSILGLYPLDASSIPFVVATKNVSKFCQVSSGRQNRPQLKPLLCAEKGPLDSSSNSLNLKVN